MFKVLFVGNSLNNPSFWKKLQIMLTLIAGFLPFIVSLFPALSPLLDKDILGKLIAGIVGINVYLTAATTDKIGLK